jgi:diguanylate cyclase (GGDEF)-like protein
MITYGASFAATWGLLGLEPHLRGTEIAVAFVLQAIVGALLFWVRRWDQRRWLGVVGSTIFIVSVALLRDGVGQTAGYSSLLLLPIFWAAVRSRRFELGWVLAGAAILLFVPIVAIGGVHYPSTGWRTGVLWITIAAGLGIAVLALVDALRSSNQRHRLLIGERQRLQLTVERQRDEATNLLAEQLALRKIATLVAAGAPPNALFAAVAEQLAQLFDAAVASVIRFDASAGVGEYVGGWSAGSTQFTGQTVDLAGNTATARVYQAGGPAQVVDYDDHSADPFLDRFSLGGGVAAPITADGGLWGAVAVALAAGRAVPVGAQERMSSFAELVAVAISSAEALETLSREATTDSLTGLANYGAFHERLLSEVERSSRHGRALSVAVLDLDHFKRVNDTHGHQIGDRVLAEVARRLGNAVRSGELMARIGGEEFAWLMPEASQGGAYAAAERVRRAIQLTPFDTAGMLTISVGVCSNEQAHTAEELVGSADQALYWAKQSGRNTIFIYTPEARRRFSGAKRVLARASR